MINNVYLKNIENSYAEDLVCILNSDKTLRDAIGSKSESTNVDEFVSVVRQWQFSTNSLTFAIVINDKAIGIISLSHIDENNRTAKVGYWIGSSYWNKGYTTQAFFQILFLAKGLNILTLTSSIKKDNIASKSIWEKFNAEFVEDDERFYPKLNL